MFAMMNHARLEVGLQGVAVAERAYQQALAFARERRQGGARILRHPDVRLMLMTMRALTQGRARSPMPWLPIGTRRCARRTGTRASGVGGASIS